MEIVAILIFLYLLGSIMAYVVVTRFIDYRQLLAKFHITLTIIFGWPILIMFIPIYPKWKLSRNRKPK